MREGTLTETVCRVNAIETLNENIISYESLLGFSGTTAISSRLGVGSREVMGEVVFKIYRRGE